MPFETLRSIVLSALMAALMGVGAYLFVPIGPVPIVLTSLFVLLAGLLLGPRWGTASAALYLLLGAMGLPVFAGGKGGLVHFWGPTGGYLFGYLLAAWVAGSLSRLFRQSWGGNILAVVIGSLILYAVGVPWLKGVTQMEWSKAFLVGMLPFLPGDALKAAAAVLLARSLKPIWDRQTRYEIA